MEMIPLPLVQHLLDRSGQSLASLRNASLWRFRHGVARMCAGLLVVLLGPVGVQQVPDCGAPHATVLRSGWMFRVFPYGGEFALVCTPILDSDHAPRAFLVPTEVLEDPNSAFGATQHLWCSGIPLGSKELGS